MATSFSAIVKIRGINPFVVVSAARANAVKSGWRKPLPVLVPAGDGSFYLYLHGDLRKASGTSVGDRVRVEIEFDAKYRGGPQPMPKWFKEALAANPRAKQSWTALTASRKKEVLRYLSRLRSEEARNRNLAKVLQMLAGKSGRFMARSWKDGS
jgi:bacteriocin resistance YdeI/OmpD-like protein